MAVRPDLGLAGSISSCSSETAPCHSVQEYEEVTSLIMPVVRPLLRPHLEDVELKIQPGAVLLTWTSMNIDGYIHIVKQVNGMSWDLQVTLHSVLC